MKIICLIAPSGAGKDTIANILIKELNIFKAVSSTTRPIREGEIPGVTYNYLTREEFKNKDFIEERQYHVFNGDVWYYGYSIDAFEEDKNYIAIVDVDGYKSLSNYFGKESVLPFYIYTRESTLRKRLIKRGDNIEEINRRLADDKIKMKNFIKSGNYYIINNDSDDINVAIKQSKKIIKYIIEEI